VYGSASFPADIDGDGLQEVVVGNALYRIDGTADLVDGRSGRIPGDGRLRRRREAGDRGGGERQGAAARRRRDDRVERGQPGAGRRSADDRGLRRRRAAGGRDRGQDGVCRVRHDGTVLWQQATQDASSSTTGSSVYDFEGDGIADVVYADEYTLWVYSGNDGTVKLEYKEHSNGTLIEYPIVVDVDNDGEVEIVVTHNNTYWGAAVGISVLGDMNKSWRPGRKIWNQHAYNITNVGDDAKVPAVPEPNWPKYNSFRSGDLSANDGLAAPDLQIVTPEGCVNECTGPDQVKLWFQLGNAGAAPLRRGRRSRCTGRSWGWRR
jgi:hypothetical protein